MTTKTPSYSELKEYIYNIENDNFPVDDIKTLHISSLDTQKPFRVFRLDMNGRRYVLKTNIVSPWDGRDRIANEYDALKLIENAQIGNVPRIHYCDTKIKFEGKDVLIISFIDHDPIKELNARHIKNLVTLLHKFHSIQSDKFSVPYGKFNEQFKGNSLDFVNKHFKIIRSGLDYYQKYSQNEIFDLFRKYVDFIKEKIHEQRHLFRQNSKFCLVHGHLTNIGGHNHILTRGKDVFIIDWESACFGEREYEIATFIYENQSISLKNKKLFLEEYSKGGSFDKAKLQIYRFLIELDDAGEYLDVLMRRGCSDSKTGQTMKNLFNKKLMSLNKQMQRW